MATYQVRLINKKQDLDTTIEVDEETTIVDAAEENGIELRSGESGTGTFSCKPLKINN